MPNIVRLKDAQEDVIGRLREAVPGLSWVQEFQSVRGGGWCEREHLAQCRLNIDIIVVFPRNTSPVGGDCGVIFSTRLSERTLSLKELEFISKTLGAALPVLHQIQADYRDVLVIA